jgi:hypothetical protein
MRVARDADAGRAMVELFGIYALLLLGWGLWRARTTAAGSDAAADAPVAARRPASVAHERGAAARRHLSTLP